MYVHLCIEMWGSFLDHSKWVIEYQTTLNQLKHGKLQHHLYIEMWGFQKKCDISETMVDLGDHPF